MRRVVVDANVYISALVFGGVPRTVLDLISSLDIELFISPSIIEEVARILQVKFKWTRQELDVLLPPLWERCSIISPATRLEICSDPDDNHVLECAQTCAAGCLITGNTKHFPKSYRTIQIVSPRQFLVLCNYLGDFHDDPI
jgi:putative PIN family toxin of toxin-antitoxin system